MKISGQQRKAISPIVATVLIVAATLIAAAAIIGYVFGVFGSASNTANIAVTSASMKSLVAASAGSITLSNTGTASAYASAVSISYQGTSCTLPSADVTGGGSALPIIGGATQTLAISLATAGQYCGTTTAISGNAYNGYVILSNGAQASFTGSFL
jgi:flagellin-like protein